MKVTTMTKFTRTSTLSLRLAIPALGLAAGVCLAGLVSPSAHAQVLTGEIDGTVRDATGAVVPKAMVTITNSDEKLKSRTIKTDSVGQFTAPLLTIGTYSVTVAAPGFKTITVDGLEVHVGQPSTVPVVLAVGAEDQQIEVTAGSLQPQLDSAAASTLIDTEQITELPLSSRNYIQLLSIQPGISGTIPGGTNDRGNIRPTGAVNTQQFSVNGNGTASNGYFLDGADTLKRAGQQPVVFPGIDFIQEINLQRALYGADFGGPGAAFVSVQTKAGTSNFHGTAFGFGRSQIFNANDPFNKASGVAVPFSRYYDYGYAVGGPVYIPRLMSRGASKTFFFFGQQFLRSETGTPQNISNIPTAAQRQGNFTATICAAYSQGNCINPTKSIAPNTFNPVAQEYLTDVINHVPLPNSPTDVQGLIFNVNGTNNETQTIIRIDHQFNSKLSVFFRYLDDPFHNLAPDGFQVTSQIPGVATSAITNGSTNWLGHFTYVLGANHVFEGGYATRANWITVKGVGLLQKANSPDVQVQLPYVNALDQIPHLQLGGSNYVVSSPYDERNPVSQIFINNTNALGRHTIKGGFNIELQRGGGNGAGANAGNFVFNATAYPGSTAFAQNFANFLVGSPSSFTQTNVDAAGANETDFYEGYVQDDFHATARLSLSLGVRYSYYVSPTSATQPGHPFTRVLNFDPRVFNPANAPAIDSTGAICTAAPCAGGVTPHAYDPLNGIIQGGLNSPYGQSVQSSPEDNFAPRFGFTYDVHGNGTTSLRGGFGIYYLAQIANPAKFATNQDAPNVVTATIQNPSFNNPGNGVPVLSAAPNVLQASQTDAKLPYNESYSLDLQQAIRQGLVLDVGYYGSNGVHQNANIDGNQPVAGAYATPAFKFLGISPGGVTAGNTQSLNVLRPYAGYSAITTSYDGFVSNYNSLQVSLRERLKNGTIFTANYTFSKALTNARTPQNNANLRAEYGPTAFNRSAIFNASFVYPLPFYRNQHGLLGHALGGYQFNGAVFFGTGQYLTATTAGVDPGGLGLLTGPGGPRPDVVADPNNGAPHTIAQWFAKSAFVSTPASQVRAGNAPIGNIIGPGYEDFDLSFYKNIRIRERQNFQLRAESFNTFNHTNLSNVVTAITSTQYGQVTSAGPKRTVQFGAKYNF